MFGLLAKLAEILSSFGQRFAEGQRGARDTDVAERLVGMAVLLQDLLVRGERLLTLAERLLAGTAEAGQDREFTELLTAQVVDLDKVSMALTDSRGLLLTVDPDLYLDLVLLLDAKAGLLSEWSRHATHGPFSTTTLFFLAEPELRQVLRVGREHAEHSTAIDSMDYLRAQSEGLRRALAGEVRDIRGAARHPHAAGVPGQLAAARDTLVRARELCRQMVAATERAVGPDVMASLRRRLATQPPGGRP